MIGSFWNLCRACPSMPLDKLHSEYRSTYRWHEYTGNSRPEAVVRRPPVANNASTGESFFSRLVDEDKQGGEPPLPRRKKCPELAYRAHEFIGTSADVVDNRSVADRARSGERETPSRRSKSAGPQSVFRDSSPGRKRVQMTYVAGSKDVVGQPTGESGLFRKTITEYRFQFVWPKCQRMTVSEVTTGTTKSTGLVDSPKKSKSMGALKRSGGHQQCKIENLPMVHRKRTTNSKEATQNELEPLFGSAQPNEKIDSLEIKMGHKKMFNGPEVNQRRSDKQNFGFVSNGIGTARQDATGGNNNGVLSNSWYKEVIELRKKAVEYKSRGWGAEIDPDFHHKQKELWDQVSRRSSLSALSLASTALRSVTKNQKDKENSKKIYSPTKGKNMIPTGEVDCVQAISSKMRRTTADWTTGGVRHHLDRTTGSMGDDGALLPSPTIDKLMPVAPRSRENSPKKSITSRHGSPQKGSPKKLSKITHKVRSQSVGANHDLATETIDRTTTNVSPKRQLRSVVLIEDNKGGGAANKVCHSGKDNKMSVYTPGERRPRPTSLSTTFKTATGPKSSSLPPSSKRAQSVPAPQSSKSLTVVSKSRDSTLTQPKLYVSGAGKPAIDSMMQSIYLPNDSSIKGPKLSLTSQANAADEIDEYGNSTQQVISDALLEPLIKSPPEPTRVKSPEQLLMRSPDPVNWTVPLDTGKTFTVTQNIREGDIRPHSEMKISMINDQPPLPSASAPPELAEQAKLDAYNRLKSNPTDVTKIIQPLSPKKTLNNVAHSNTLPIRGGNCREEEEKADNSKKVLESPGTHIDKCTPASTIRILDDPLFSNNVPIAAASKPIINCDNNESEARNRFDKFWGGKEGITVVPINGDD